MRRSRRARVRRNRRIAVCAAGVISGIAIVCVSWGLSNKDNEHVVIGDNVYASGESQSPPPAITEPTTKPTIEPTVEPTIVPTIEPSIEPTTPPTTTTTTSTYDFSDAAFVGDSRTLGLQLNTGLTTAKFYAAKGLMVDSALTETSIPLGNGKKGTVIDGLKQKQFKRIYLMFGLNELGWPYKEVFVNRYVKLIQEIQKVQPNATIYVQSILPVSKKKSDGDTIYNNANIKKFNGWIKEMAEQNGYVYVDVASQVADSTHSLPADASTDGVHFNRAYCEKWLNYLRAY